MGKGSILLVLTATFGLAAAMPSGALASSGDAAATQAYLQANYALVKVARAHLATSEAAPLRLLAQVRRECPLAGAGSPQDSESTQMSDEVIGAMVIAAAIPDRQAITAFTRSAGALRWSNSGLTHAIGRYVANLKTLLSLSAPNLCGDVKAWAAGGYRTLPASTVAFVGKFMPAWVALGYVPAQLAASETSAGRALVRLAGGLEQQLTEGEARAVEHWGEIMNALVLNP
jgi:hypothetical protein